MLKEDLTLFPTEPSTYEVDYRQKGDFPNVGEPRYIRPKLEPNASLKQLSNEAPTNPGAVDKFLYVSLYQSTFNNEQTSKNSMKLDHGSRAIGTIPSLYQDSYVNPSTCVNERKLLDNNKGMRQTYKKEAAGKGVSGLMHLIDAPLPITSYKTEFEASQAIVDKGAPPSFSSDSHPLATRQVVAKAYKYRRYG
ncbi:hypothetical protein BC829DRAFT_443210 [Chytridium lagenaria]|nr:hypothetical protein BC829DRAFT_443210 [Chytridium lagenaria]